VANTIDKVSWHHGNGGLIFGVKSTGFRAPITLNQITQNCALISLFISC